MTSTRRILANRQNALRSTGPKTTKGKAAAALNALKHGLTGKQVIVLPDEKPEEFDALLHEIADAYEPATRIEFHLVEALATSIWRLRRLHRLEAPMMLAAIHQAQVERANELHLQPNVIGDGVPGSPAGLPLNSARQAAKRLMSESLEAMQTQAVRQGEGLLWALRSGDALSKFSRYEADLERKLYQALHALNGIKQRREDQNERALTHQPRGEEEA